MRNWRKKALKRLKQGKGAKVDFESVHIEDEQHAAIEAALAEAETPEELHQAFSEERLIKD